MMFFMVTMMKYMNRYVPGLARPLVQWVGDNEVIACGLRLPDSPEPVVIFSPHAQEAHRICLKKSDKNYTLDKQRTSFIGDLVVSHELNGTRVGEVYTIHAKNSSTGKKVSSPNIQIKEATEINNRALIIKQKETDDNTEIHLSWPELAKNYDAMIYFLGFHSEETGYFGIYTREMQFTYPAANEASLFLPNNKAVQLPTNDSVTITLCAVDYNGWVPVMASQEI